MNIKRSFKLILFILFSPIYIESPVFALTCFNSGRQQVCYDNITYYYDIVDPDWAIAGSCSRNQLYKVLDISLKEAQSWHKSLCSGWGF